MLAIAIGCVWASNFRVGHNRAFRGFLSDAETASRVAVPMYRVVMGDPYMKLLARVGAQRDDGLWLTSGEVKHDLASQDIIVEPYHMILDPTSGAVRFLFSTGGPTKEDLRRILKVRSKLRIVASDPATDASTGDFPADRAPTMDRHLAHKIVANNHDFLGFVPDAVTAERVAVAMFRQTMPFGKTPSKETLNARRWGPFWIVVDRCSFGGEKEKYTIVLGVDSGGAVAFSLGHKVPLSVLNDAEAYPERLQIIQ